MRFAVILNRDGGTLRTTDLDALSRQLRNILGTAGNSVDIDVVEGAKIEAALEQAERRADIDTVMVGGGDGTISAAAAMLKGTDKSLAVLPAGTMNLFARGLGIPLNLNDAISAFARGKVKAVDTASANGKPFIHQFSIGMHAKMVRLREQMEFSSRLGKIRASASAAVATLRDPPAMKVVLRIGEAEVSTRTTGIGISNNLFGEGHLPYADDPAGGVLGVYIMVADRPERLIRLAVNLARGRWRDNEQVEIHQAGRVGMKILSGAERFSAVLDGELIRLERQTEIEIQPRSLKVLVPYKSDL
jgi:diacylglycerol kinase family enzyme